MSEDRVARVSVRLLDREYQVACPAEERSDLLDSAEYLDAKMREVRDTGKVVGLDRIAVISALNLANELIKLRRNGSSVDAELADATAQRKVSKSAEAGMLMPLTVELPQHDNGNTENRFDLSVVNAPAVQVFMAIVTGTKYNMLVGPEVTGTITVNLKDVSVKEALEDPARLILDV